MKVSLVFLVLLLLPAVVVQATKAKAVANRKKCLAALARNCKACDTPCHLQALKSIQVCAKQPASLRKQVKQHITFLCTLNFFKNSNKLATFGGNATYYGDPAQVQSDLNAAARFILNQVVKRNLQQYGNYQTVVGCASPVLMTGAVASGGGIMTNAGAGKVSAAATNVAGDVMTDYGSNNNQETGVEEGDMVVSDGTNVYIAYGDYVVVYNVATGAEVVQFQMPPTANITGGGGTGYSNNTIVPSGWANATNKGATVSGVVDMPIYKPKPMVRSLLLDQGSNRLLVIVDGYSSTRIHDMLAEPPVLYDFYNTQIRVYDTIQLTSGVSTEPIATHDVHGSFSSLRLVNGTAHLMTTSGIDVQTDLITPFERWNFPLNMSDADYIAYVQKTADPKSIDHFTSRLMQELTAQDGSFPTLAKLELLTNEQAMADLLLQQGPINTYAQIATFDITAPKLVVSLSGVFLASYSCQFYTSETTVIVAGQGTAYNSQTNTAFPRTHLFAFGMNNTDASTTPTFSGETDGALLNDDYAMDVVENVLRVAVTVQANQCQWWWGPQQTMAWTPPPVENFVVTMAMPSDTGGVMMELDRLSVAKANETVTTVRFFDHVAYVVSLSNDYPLYVVNLDDPQNLVNVGELAISAGLNDLHSMNADNTLILAIGQEVDIVSGQVLGVVIIIFDAIIPSQPVVLQRHVIEQANNTYAYTDASYDFKAARYADGRLILPLDVYDWGVTATNEFHGFVVFEANVNSIQEECRIAQANETQSDKPCYYCSGSLPRRSMIFNGDLLTMENHFLRSTNMTVCAQFWETSINVTSATGDGCCYPNIF